MEETAANKANKAITVEITVKFSQLPEARTVENGWKEFSVEVLGKEIVIKVKPKTFNKIEKGATQYPEWVAKFSGKLEKAEKGFMLSEATFGGIFAKQSAAHSENETPGEKTASTVTEGEGKDNGKR